MRGIVLSTSIKVMICKEKHYSIISTKKDGKNERTNEYGVIKM